MIIFFVSYPAVGWYNLLFRANIKFYSVFFLFNLNDLVVSAEMVMAMASGVARSKFLGSQNCELVWWSFLGDQFWKGNYFRSKMKVKTEISSVQARSFSYFGPNCYHAFLWPGLNRLRCGAFASFSYCYVYNVISVSWHIRRLCEKFLLFNTSLYWQTLHNKKRFFN